MRYVSIIIPTYNRAEMLRVTVESFLAQDYPNDCFEIIIVDNNSTDSTRMVAEKYSGRTDPVVSYLFERRQGVHYARNSAAKKARGDILYFTDDDMVAEPSLIAELVKVFDLDPHIGSATGKIVGRFDVPPPEWVRKYMVNNLLSLTGEDKPEELVISSDDIVYSCHQAVRREAFFSCGGFNPENTAGVWVGDGETGLGIKMKQAGYRFAYTPKSVIYHLIPQSRTTLCYLIKRIGNQGNCDAYTEYRKHRDRNRIFHDLLRKHSLNYLRLLTYTVKDILNKKESWQFLPAQIAYIYKRTKYDLRLYFNPDFRELAEVDDWINSD